MSRHDTLLIAVWAASGTSGTRKYVETCGKSVLGTPCGKKGITAWVSRAAVCRRSDRNESSRISPFSFRKDLGSNFPNTGTISFTKPISPRTLSVTQTRIPMPTKTATGFMLDSSPALQRFYSKSPWVLLRADDVETSC